MLMIFYILCIFFNTFAEDIKNNIDVQKVNDMLSFAKNALIENTALAKKEFNMEEQAPAEEDDSIYNNAEHRDIFFNAEDSKMVNKALDYFKKGKLLNFEKKESPTKKVQIIKKPLLRLSSIMYNNTSMWTVFTNVGKFDNNKPFSGNIKVLNFSNTEIEFSIPISKILKETLKKQEEILLDNERMRAEKDNIVITLRTGECIFEDDLRITKNCAPIIEEIEKQVEL